jgi:hypothetical protein
MLRREFYKIVRVEKADLFSLIRAGQLLKIEVFDHVIIGIQPTARLDPSATSTPELTLYEQQHVTSDHRPHLDNAKGKARAPSAGGSLRALAACARRCEHPGAKSSPFLKPPQLTRRGIPNRNRRRPHSRFPLHGDGSFRGRPS